MGWNLIVFSFFVRTGMIIVFSLDRSSVAVTCTVLLNPWRSRCDRLCLFMWNLISRFTFCSLRFKKKKKWTKPLWSEWSCTLATLQFCSKTPPPKNPGRDIHVDLFWSIKPPQNLHANSTPRTRISQLWLCLQHQSAHCWRVGGRGGTVFRVVSVPDVLCDFPSYMHAIIGVCYRNIWLHLGTRRYLFPCQWTECCDLLVENSLVTLQSVHEKKNPARGAAIGNDRE